RTGISSSSSRRSGTMARWDARCSTCHDPAHAFTDGRPTSIGIDGRVGQRNAPSILNALYNKTQFWDGRAKTLEEQAALPIVNPIERGQPSMDAARTRIAAVAEYQGIIRHNVVALARQAEQLIDSGDPSAIDRAAIQTDMSALGRFLITKKASDIASF